MKRLLILAVVAFTSFSFQHSWSAKLKEKIDKTVKATYSSDDDLLLSVISIDDEQEASTKSKLANSLYKVSDQSEEIGHIYVNQAPSMKNVFDYIVLFDNEWELVNTKVLIYRETHGRQIGSKRWLSQFIGMGPEDRPALGSDIDGITGATISVNGMTSAIHDLLLSIDHLRKNGSL